MKYDMFSKDAQQQSLNFLIQQGTLIEPEVYKMKYVDIQYRELIPVDTSAPEWIQTITFFSQDAVGQARWFAGRAQDIQHVGLTREKFTSAVHMAAIGYDYDLEELGTAQLYGWNLSSDKASMARRASEEFIEQHAFSGSAIKGQTGLFNSTAPTATSAPADGTAGSRAWADKTPDQIMRDFNSQLAGVGTDTKYAELADTVLLPYSILESLSTLRLNDQSETTVLGWIEKNNIYTRTTGRRLTIRGVIASLDTAGTGNTKRMVAYRRHPEVLKMHIPMPFRFLPAWQSGPLTYEVPGIFRLGPVDIRRPKAVRYLDQI